MIIISALRTFLKDISPLFLLKFAILLHFKLSSQFQGNNLTSNFSEPLDPTIISIAFLVLDVFFSLNFLYFMLCSCLDLRSLHGRIEDMKMKRNDAKKTKVAKTRVRPQGHFLRARLRNLRF